MPRLITEVRDFIACSTIGSAMSVATGLADLAPFPSILGDQVFTQFSIASGVQGTAKTASSPLQRIDFIHHGLVGKYGNEHGWLGYPLQRLDGFATHLSAAGQRHGLVFDQCIVDGRA